ncbi:protein LEAD-SENSITIVE 1-like [Syzygium oleosum]|uniref:protein LEAD-SENSITIVE 1-like n=1 Tax=Syzygium oleosum TaxID=219896 RepID=UPI0024BA91CF|nr:protein LEAD-SENSITIVE 1-like [Syzygium oleosum]
MFPSLSKTCHNQETLPPCPECEYQETTKRGVVKTCLDCFRRDGKKLRSLHLYEYRRPLLGFKLTRRGTCTTLLDTKLPQQVVDKACKLHANNAFGDYSLIDNNCEHFATFCWTGIRASEQMAIVNDYVRKFKEAKERLLQRN